MTNNIINQLAAKDIHAYGTEALLKVEKDLTRYFEREYERWQGNRNTPESYGVSSFEGDISKIEKRHASMSHYNEEYQAYRAFLDKTYMAYTMGYFGATEDSPEIKNISLEQAQADKYNLLIERADIQDGQTVLDLGCGFGGLSKHLLQTFPDLKITGINPSVVQTRHIREELIPNDNEFDGDRFTLIQAFFDDITADTIEDNVFDRVISIGLLEHVNNIELLQKHISRVLKPGGQCLHHCIVSFDTIPGFLNSEDSHMGNYYPDAHIWPYNEATRHNTHLKFINSWFINGMNYWKTLDEWHKRFWESIKQLYPVYLTIEEVENWNKYFVLCKAMFHPDSGKSYGNGQYLYEKHQ